MHMSLSLSLRKYLAVGGAAVMLGAAAVGVSIVQAQTTPAPSPSPSPAPTQTQPQQQRQAAADRYLAALAARLNITVDQLKQAMQAARQDAGIPDRSAKPPFDGRGGRGPGGPGGSGIPGFGFPGRGPAGGFLGQQIDAVATLFKITPEQLRTEIAGKTLAEVAAAHGVSAQDTVNTIVTTTNQQIDQMAAQRNIPAERVTELKSQLTQRTTELVNNFRFPQPRNRTASTTS
jgi:hypothetical protein